MATLAPIFGLIGVAAGISIDATVSAICAVILARRVMQVPMPAMLAAIAAPGAAALLMVAVLFPVEALRVDAAGHGTAIDLPLLTLEGLFGFAIYAVAVWTISPSLLGQLRETLRDARRTRRKDPGRGRRGAARRRAPGAVDGKRGKGEEGRAITCVQELFISDA